MSISVAPSRLQFDLLWSKNKLFINTSKNIASMYKQKFPASSADSFFFNEKYQKKESFLSNFAPIVDIKK